MNNDLFDSALKFVLKWEGGFVNNPNDFGGPTNMGICQKTYDNFNSLKKLPPASVQNISYDEVREIYFKHYWQNCNCGEMHPVFAVLVFDTAVNMGKSRAMEFLKLAKWCDSDKFALERIKKYASFAKKPSQRNFLLGWINRVFDLLDIVETLK